MMVRRELLCQIRRGPGVTASTAAGEDLRPRLILTVIDDTTVAFANYTVS